MQRLFNMFPPGLPGLGLLALRASVALALQCNNIDHGHLFSGWAQIAGYLLSIALCIGYLTPVVAGASLLFHAVVWSLLGVASLLMATIVVLDILALGLLGPGAYSIDSYRFGRRVVVLPPR